MTKLNLNKLSQDYKKNGFVIIRKFVSKKKIEILKNILANIFKNRISFYNLNNFNKLKLDWNSKLFNQEIYSIRNNHPEIFSKVYNDIKNNSHLIEILNEKKIINTASFLLNTKPKYVWNGEYMMRMDSPNDKRNNLGWHQELYYYKKQTLNGDNGIIVWIAVSNIINEHNGAVQVCKSSHKEGAVSTHPKIAKVAVNKKFKSITYSVPKKFIKKYKPISIKMKIGDIIFMNMKTFHRSGKNSSKFFRLSTVSRLFDMTSKYWPAN